MTPSILIRLVSAALVATSLLTAQSAPSDPSAPAAPKAAAKAEAEAEAKAAAKANERMQVRLAEVIAMLAEDDLTPEQRAAAKQKLEEIVARLRKDKAPSKATATAGRTHETKPELLARTLERLEAGDIVVEGGVAVMSDPAPVAEEPKVSGRRWRVAKLPPLVSSTEAPEPAEPPEPPSPVAAPKPPKAPKAVIGLPWPNAATDEMAILEVEGKPMRLRRASPDFVVVEAPATVAVEGHPDVVPQRKRVHDEALKAHEKALRAHQIATEVHERAVAEAQQNLERVWHEMERDLRRKVRSEQPEVEALEMAKARIDAAREGVQERARGLTRSRAAEAKVPGHRVAPATADDGEIRALIEEMRAEMREIRSLIKQMREQAGHEEKQARATPGAGASPNLLAPNSQGGAGRAGAPGSSGGSTNHGQHSHAEGSESSSLAPLNTGSTAVGAGTGDRLIGVNGQRVGSRTEALRVARQQYGLGTRTFNTQWQHGDRVVERTYQAAGR